MKPSKGKSYDFVKRCILSCKTPDQLLMAFNLKKNFGKIFTEYSAECDLDRTWERMRSKIMKNE